MNGPASGPVFIVGYPRSGTTLLLHFLLSSGQFPFYSFTETHFYSHFYRRYGSLRSNRGRQAFVTAVTESEWVSSAPFSIDEVLAELPLEWKHGELLRAFMDRLAASQNKARWVEKTPWHILYLDEIRRDFPDARLVHIVRDPRDVLLSVAGAGWSSMSKAALARMSMSWAYHVQQVESLPDEVIMTLRYEDLILEPGATLESLNQFLGTSMSLGSILETADGVMSGSNSSVKGQRGAIVGLSGKPVGRWRSSDMSERLSIVDGIARSMMLRYGYDPRESSWSPLQSLAKFSYTAQKRVKRLIFPVVRR